MLLSCQYAIQRESTLHKCLNVKKLLPRNRRDIWSLRDSKWLSCVVSTYLYGAFDWIYTLMSVRLRTKWLWVRIPLLSLKPFSNISIVDFEQENANWDVNSTKTNYYSYRSNNEFLIANLVCTKVCLQIDWWSAAKRLIYLLQYPAPYSAS